MATGRKTGHPNQGDGESTEHFDPKVGGVSALAQSALDRLARSSRAEAQNIPHNFAKNADVHAFTQAIIRGDTDTAMREISRLADDGAKYEWIADTLIAGAARALGAMWEQNALSFIKVSLGISELLRINSELRRRWSVRPKAKEALAVFATIQGQGHTLGIILAAEAFRQNGWEVEMLLDADADHVLSEIELCKPVFVGLTAGRDNRLGDIGSLLSQLKALDPAPRIILGGHAVSQTGILEQVEHVDEVVNSIEDALVAAQRFM